MYNSQDIVQKIKLKAKEKNISINQLLSNCELGKNTITKMSNGNDILTKNFAKIADHLDCSIDYLLGRKENAVINEISNIYNELNEDGKSKVKDYINDLLANPAYTNKAKENGD